MLMIVCGGDGVGKTTLCNGLVKDGWELAHFSQPRDMADGKQQYTSFLNNLSDGKNYLCDRFHDGEHVYAPLYRGYTADYLEEIEDRMMNLNHPVVLVYVTALEQDVLHRVDQRGEDYVKRDDHRHVHELYQRFMMKQTLPFVIVNTSELNQDEALAEVNDVVRVVHEIYDPMYVGTCDDACSAPRASEGGHRAIPRGNLRARYVFVGQNPGHIDAEASNVRAWTFARSSALLVDVLRSTGVYLNSWLTNAVLCETPDNKVTKDQVRACSENLRRQLEIVDPEVVVALGDVAHEACRAIGVDATRQLEKVEHPASVERFNRKDAFRRDVMRIVERYGGNRLYV